MKIFIGMENVTSLYHEYCTGFRALGHEIFTVTTVDRAHFGFDSVDMSIPVLVGKKLVEENNNSPERQEYWINFYRKIAWEKALEADLCLFIWQSFRPDGKDLPELKRRGKKIIVRFCGSEVRDYDVAEQFRQFHNQPSTNQKNDPLVHSFPQNLQYLRMAEKYADLLLCGSEMSLRPFYSSTSMLDISNIPHNATQRKEPILLHAPTDWAKKGTADWLHVFRLLREAGLNFGVKLCEGMRHSEFIKEYSTADIYCGSMFTGGKADIEAMAAGCVVYSTWPQYDKKYLEYIDAYLEKNARILGFSPEQHKRAYELAQDRNPYSPGSNAPVVPVKKESVLMDLGELIMDYERRCKLAAAGRPFVEKYFSCKAHCAEILGMLEDPEHWENQARLNRAEFFNLHYKPGADKNRIEIFNEYTRLVSETPWYKKWIEPCERDGLVF